MTISCISFSHRHQLCLYSAQSLVIGAYSSSVSTLLCCFNWQLPLLRHALTRCSLSQCLLHHRALAHPLGRILTAVAHFVNFLVRSLLRTYVEGCDHLEFFSQCI